MTVTLLVGISTATGWTTLTQVALWCSSTLSNLLSIRPEVRVRTFCKHKCYQKAKQEPKFTNTTLSLGGFVAMWGTKKKKKVSTFSRVVVGNSTNRVNALTLVMALWYRRTDSKDHPCTFGHNYRIHCSLAVLLVHYYLHLFLGLHVPCA